MRLQERRCSRCCFARAPNTPPARAPKCAAAGAAGERRRPRTQHGGRPSTKHGSGSVAPCLVDAQTRCARPARWAPPHRRTAVNGPGGAARRCRVTASLRGAAGGAGVILGVQEGGGRHTRRGRALGALTRARRRAGTCPGARAAAGSRLGGCGREIGFPSLVALSLCAAERRGRLYPVPAGPDVEMGSRLWRRGSKRFAISDAETSRAAVPPPRAAPQQGRFHIRSVTLAQLAHL
jgi:hypothetical protein